MGFGNIPAKARGAGVTRGSGASTVMQEKSHAPYTRVGGAGRLAREGPGPVSRERIVPIIPADADWPSLPSSSATGAPGAETPPAPPLPAAPPFTINVGAETLEDALWTMA